MYGSKKELADNIITLLALESHYNFQNVDFEIIFCSSDSGFDATVTNLKAHHRQARRLCREGQIKLFDILKMLAK